MPQKSHRRFCTVACLLRRNGFGVGLIAVPLFFEGKVNLPGNSVEPFVPGKIDLGKSSGLDGRN